MSYLGNTPGVSSQRLVSSFTATAGQTTFTPSGGYSLGYVDVLINGIELDTTDFTAANGVTIVLTTACVAGDEVKIKAWLPRGLSDGYTKTEADARYDAIGAASTAQTNAQTYAAAAASTAQTNAQTYAVGLVDDLSGVTNQATARTNIGLGNVENKSSATIRSEITSGNVTTALGYTPATTGKAIAMAIVFGG